jgi:uncharacterized membrane protein
METLAIGVLVSIQIAAVCFALFLFTRSISGFSRNEAKRTATKLINTVLVLILTGVILHLYGPVFKLFKLFMLFR